MPLFSDRYLSLPHCPEWCLCSPCKGCWEGSLRPYGKAKGQNMVSFIFMKGNDRKWSPSSFQILYLRALITVYLSPVAVFWVAWWSQGQSEIPAIRLILREWNTRAQASVTRKPSGEAVVQEPARTHYFYGSWAIPMCCEGSLPG